MRFLFLVGLLPRRRSRSLFILRGLLRTTRNRREGERIRAGVFPGLEREALAFGFDSRRESVGFFSLVRHSEGGYISFSDTLFLQIWTYRQTKGCEDGFSETVRMEDRLVGLSKDAFARRRGERAADPRTSRKLRIAAVIDRQSGHRPGIVLSRRTTLENQARLHR
ncbi:hypothetical protein CPC08DRAFT_441424 [Agrocybe pediades]|nr:hypothetical protein CPC08DRAFT_441424 [Agrocybe pediades]